MNGKFCAICVYSGICQGRVTNLSITDCCVPEKPLRQLQAAALTAEKYIQDTKDYIKSVKTQSAYWSTQQ